MPLEKLFELHNFALNLCVNCISGALWERWEEGDWLLGDRSFQALRPCLPPSAPL